MRRVEFAIITLSVFFGMGLAEASNGTISNCNRIAEMCRRDSSGRILDVECTRKYDECMNHARCDDVYMSCLELREEDPDVAEHICTAAREKCILAGSGK